MPPLVTMLRPQQNMKRQTPSVHHLEGSCQDHVQGTVAHLLFFPLRLGNRSRRTVTTVSTVENWVPKPRDKSIMKKRIDQRGEIGILETASG